MLFSSTAGWFLIGLVATAVISLFTAIGTQGSPKQFTAPLHWIVIAIYAPLLALLTNSLGHYLTEKPSSVWLILSLILTVAIVSHGLWASLIRIDDLKKLLSHRDLDLPTEPFSHEPPPGASRGLILVNLSIAEYRTAVVSAEANGRDFAFIQRRIAPYLLSDSTLKFIAAQRFGDGHSEMHAYVASHLLRRQAFMQSLESGAKYREVFSRKTLLDYVKTGTHSEEMWPLPPTAVIDLLKNWQETLLQYPNYYVAISDHNLPLKYHLIDNECVILHEPVGKGEDIRLNSFSIYSREIGTKVRKDFEIIWGMTDPEWRDRHRIARWIKSELIPLARQR
jgi:hypothetical protein